MGRRAQGQCAHAAAVGWAGGLAWLSSRPLLCPCFSAFPSLFRKRNKQIMAMVKNGVDILVR